MINNKKRSRGGSTFVLSNILAVLSAAVFFTVLFSAAGALFYSGGAACAAENISFANLCEQGLYAPAPLSKPPEKIAVFYPQSLSLIYLFGVQNKVSVLPLSKVKISLHDGGFFSQLDPGILSKKDGGYPAKPDIEVITGAGPDIIISPTFKIKADAFFEKLKIPLFRVHGTFAKYENWLDAVLKFGELFGQKQKAAEYNQYFKKTIELTSVRPETGETAVKNTKKAAHIVINANKYIAGGKKSRFIKWFLTNMGCEVLDYPDSAADEVVLSVEDIVKFDPEYIFIDTVTHAGGIENASLKILKEDFWKKLRAYKENKIYFVPADDNTCFLTNRFFILCAPLGILWAAKMLHPEKFSEIDLEKENEMFYRKFLNADYKKMAGPNSGVK
ncbi:MAG TPA: hypothetical protein DC017_09610 [Candidatus Wallbacteria bacterium]|nr:hypothetical protein [Candidatus Wallbacteria bacterium]